MRREIKWATSASALLLGVAFVMLAAGGATRNWELIGQAAVLALIGVGAAVLSLHER